MSQKYRIYSDLSIIGYPSLSSGRKKEKHHKDNVKALIESEIESITDSAVELVQPVKTLAKVYSSADGQGLSTRARKKIRRLISSYAMLELHKGQFVTWTTFTLPDHLSGVYNPEKDDRLVQKAFKEWLKKQKYNGLDAYLWIAERQDGKRNGFSQKTDRIHFHAILVWSKKHDIKYLNLSWLHEISKLNYEVFIQPDRIDAKINKGLTYFKKFNGVVQEVKKPALIDNPLLIQKYAKSKGLKIVTKLQLPDFIKSMTLDCINVCKQQHYKKAFTHLPHGVDLNNILLNFVHNSVDIEVLSDFKHVQVYLTKYITKQDENAEVFCRPWACCTEFSKLQAAMNLTFDQYDEIKSNPENIYKSRVYRKDIAGRKLEFNMDSLTPAVVQTDAYQKFRTFVELHNEKDMTKYSEDIKELLDTYVPQFNFKLKRQFLEIKSESQLLSFCMFNTVDDIETNLRMKRLPWLAAVIRQLKPVRPEIIALEKWVVN